MEPSIGRIVRYQAVGGVEYAAIITGLEPGGAVALAVFPPACVMSAHTHVPHDESDEPAAHTWHWPKREA